MKESLKAYIKVTEQKNTLIQVLSFSLNKETINKLTDKELNSFTSHFQEILNTYNEFESSGELAKGKLYLLSLYMGKIVEDWLDIKGEK